MKKTSIFILAIITIISCDNNSGMQDAIRYTALNPAVRISTVKSYNLEDHSVCTVYVPVPEDSVVTYWLDIDNDDEDDFILNVSHNRWAGTEYCGQCSVFEYQITISGAGTNNFISNDTNFSWNPHWYSLNDTIQSTDHWFKDVFLSMEGGCDRWLIDIKDTYVGIKHNKNYGWIHIAPLSNNGIEISEYAINQMGNRPIIAGQKN